MDPFTTKPWTVFKLLKRFPDSIPRRVRGGQILWVLQGGQGGDETWDGGYVRFNFEGKPDAVFNQEMHVAQRRHQLQEKKGQKHEQRRRGSHTDSKEHQQDDPGAGGQGSSEVHGHHLPR
jgi:hypothetical protein